MNRNPLSNSEMNETVTELLDSKDFKSDRDRAQFLAGMKLGILSATEFESEEALRMCGIVFNFQQVYDPEGETWDKPNNQKD